MFREKVARGSGSPHNPVGTRLQVHTRQPCLRGGQPACLVFESLKNILCPRYGRNLRYEESKSNMTKNDVDELAMKAAIEEARIASSEGKVSSETSILFYNKKVSPPTTP